MLKIDENKLNQYLRNLTKMHHDLLNLKNDDDDKNSSEKQSIFEIENNINKFENIIKNYRKDMDNHNLIFSNIISVDWLQSSINLENKLNQLQKENAKLRLQIDDTQKTQ